MQYSAYPGRGGAAAHAGEAPPRERGAALLQALGRRVRTLRTSQGLTLKALAEGARVSQRFLAQLEAGEGNVSVVRLQEIASALGTTLAALVEGCEASSAKSAPRKRERRPVVALLGLRGAGKSTIGARVAERLGLPFIELDALVAREAGMSLATMFEMHGEAYFRRVERETLRRLLERTRGAVIATGGSIVTDPETFALLQKNATTVWLKASPRDHWDRVVAQGDVRPMRDRPAAMNELRELLVRRGPLYEKADHVINTSAVSLENAVNRLIDIAEKKEKGS
jgi:XRE family aerobic/anaerobic benzoate catabolism transcriptional regulator